MTEGRYIAYYRVSTDRQGKSGLGLEAQRKAVEDYLNGGNWELAGEYTEVESGKKKDRPELEKALTSCKKNKATLVIAKLDRLGRNVAFISSLMESKVEFICCDNPAANKLMLQMLAVFAEHERDQISERTKAALAAAKARGVELGKYGKEVLSKQNKRRADDFAWSMKPIIEEIKCSGYTTERAITGQLNQRGIHSARGTARWYQPNVHYLLKRIERLKSMNFTLDIICGLC